jgi:small multidrug resistance pump
MNWVYLTLAIFSEVIGTMLIKVSNGFNRLVPTALLILFYLLSYFFFNLSLKKMELGTAYAVWSGLGTALLAGLGMIFYREELSFHRVAAILLIIIGVCLLNITKGKEEIGTKGQSEIGMK